MNRVYSLCMECNAATGYPCYNGDNERMSGVHDSRAMIHGDDVDTLTAENAALREALRACITDEGAHCYQTGSVHAFDCRIKGINAEARAALAIADGADGRCKECGEHLDDGHGPHCDTGGNL